MAMAPVPHDRLPLAMKFLQPGAMSTRNEAKDGHDADRQPVAQCSLTAAALPYIKWNSLNLDVSHVKSLAGQLALLSSGEVLGRSQCRSRGL